MPTIPQTQLILQSYFQTGDTPNQDQFTELIGTMFYLYNDMVNRAQAALDAANAAEAAATAEPFALYVATYVHATGAFTTNRQRNVTSIARINNDNGSAYAYMRITFTTPFPDAHYYVIFKQIDPGNPPVAPQILNQTANSVDLCWAQGLLTQGDGQQLYMVAF